MARISSYDWLKALKCQEIYEYVTCEVFDEILIPKFQNEDGKLYEIVKGAIIPDYERLRAKKTYSSHSELHCKIKKFCDAKQVSSAKTEYINKI